MFTNRGPVLEQLPSGVAQELRTRLSQMMEGYALTQINELQNELHRGHYKRRNPRWSAARQVLVRDRSGKMVYETVIKRDLEEPLNRELEKEISLYRTTLTVIKNNLSMEAAAAGARSEEDFERIIPTLWNEYLQRTRQEMHPTEPVLSTESVLVVVDNPAPLPEEAPTLQGMTPIQVFNRPEIPEDAPRSPVTPPEQLTLGDVLAKIEKKSNPK